MPSLPAPPDHRKPGPAACPARGTFRWLQLPTEQQPGRLHVNGTAYLVHPVRENGRVIGYWLEKAGPATDREGAAS
jgi:hypothetical protein